jgi:hypothetical protein
MENMMIIENMASVDLKSALRQDILHAINASACKWKLGDGLAHERMNVIRTWPASFTIIAPNQKKFSFLPAFFSRLLFL